MSKYTREQYNRGNPNLNLYRMERRLLIKALVKTKWNIKDALSLNFPKGNVSYNLYIKMLSKHHITAKKKSFVKLDDIN